MRPRKMTEQTVTHTYLVQDAQSPATSEFGEALRDYLAALRLPPADAAHVSALVNCHDFSSARAALLPSVPGCHCGWTRPASLGFMCI